MWSIQATSGSAASAQSASSNTGTDNQTVELPAGLDEREAKSTQPARKKPKTKPRTTNTDRHRKEHKQVGGGSASSAPHGTVLTSGDAHSRPGLVGHPGDHFIVRKEGRPILVKVLDNTTEDSASGLTTVQFMRSYDSKKHTVSVAARKYFLSWTDHEYKEVWVTRKPKGHVVTSGWITQADVLVGPFEMNGQCIPQSIVDRTEQEVRNANSRRGQTPIDPKIL